MPFVWEAAKFLYCFLISIRWTIKLLSQHPQTIFPSFTLSKMLTSTYYRGQQTLAPWSQTQQRAVQVVKFLCNSAAAAAAAAKSLQPCPTLRPHRRQTTRLPRPWDSPGKNTGVGCHFLLQCVKVRSESEVAQLCPTPSDPLDCSLPGSSIHWIFQARVLEWGAIAFSVCVTQTSLFVHVSSVTAFT